MRIGTWLLLLFSVLMQLFTVFLLCFHCKLMNLNQTTNEYLKQRLKDRNFQFRPPLWCQRLHHAVCRRRQPSLITNDMVRISLLIEQLNEAES